MIRGRRRRSRGQDIAEAAEAVEEALADIHANVPRLRQAKDDLIATLHHLGGGDHARHPRPHHP